MVKLSIDGKLIEAREGATILEAASEAGIYIPSLCYHESLSPSGSCRLCTVEIITNGRSGLTAACSYPVEDGLKVITNSDRVNEARRLAIEVLLAQNPDSVRIQELARRLGVDKPSFTLKVRECILC